MYVVEWDVEHVCHGMHWRSEELVGVILLPCGGED